MSLYRGDLLAGFYDDWIPPAAAELSEIANSLKELLPASGLLADGSSHDRPSASPIDNLPRISNPFVGRERDIERLTALHATYPLVSIVGMGGVGKTRLSLEFGKRLVRAGSPVWLVGFAGASPDVSISEEILRQTGGGRSDGTDPLKQLADRFDDTEATLILDNLEHLVTAEAEVPTIVNRLRNTRFITTTRIRLNLELEEMLDLGALPLPAGDQGLDSLRSNPSVALFVTRAASAYPGFQLTERNRAAVVELCRKLSGIALAIELAAARTQVYGLREMIAQMDRPLEFLVGRSKDRSERHRSLRAAIDWSIRLLSPRARDLFPKLALARGELEPARGQASPRLRRGP